MLIQEVPLAYRNFQAALVVVPGATRPHRVHSEFFNSQDSLSTEVNGQSRLANNVILEGIDNNHKTGLLTVLIPSAEAIETVSVTTSNYDAEFGRAGGAVTAVTLRSGTNDFKGSAFVGGNTEATMASGYFATTKAADQDCRLRVRRSAVRSCATGRSSLATTSAPSTTPVACSARSFRRSSSEMAISAARPRTVYNPFTGNADGTGRQPFPGNVIPAGMISPIAREHSGADSRAEHRRRAARADQLRAGVSTEEDHRRLRREDQSPAVGSQCAVGAVQLSASRHQRPWHLRRLWRRRQRTLPASAPT